MACGRFQRPSAGLSGRWRKKGGPDEPDDHALGKSQGGWDTKIHLICRAVGLVLAVLLSPGQRHESLFFAPLLSQSLQQADQLGVPRPKKLAGDKAYRSKHIRQRLRDEGIEDVIPAQKNEAPVDIDMEAYKLRNFVERLFGWLKQWRAVATRYDKLARNYAATLTVALIERNLRAAA